MVAIVAVHRSLDDDIATKRQNNLAIAFDDNVFTNRINFALRVFDRYRVFVSTTDKPELAIYRDNR